MSRHCSVKFVNFKLAMSAIDFHLPKIGRGLKQPRDGTHKQTSTLISTPLPSDKSYTPSTKAINAMEAYRSSPQRKKYQSMLQSMLNPKNETPEPHATQSLNV